MVDAAQAEDRVLAERQKRCKTFQCRVTEREADSLRAAAAADGKTLTGYLLALHRAYQATQFGDATVARLLAAARALSFECDIVLAAAGITALPRLANALAAMRAILKLYR